MLVTSPNCVKYCFISFSWKPWGTCPRYTTPLSSDAFGVLTCLFSPLLIWTDKQKQLRTARATAERPTKPRAERTKFWRSMVELFAFYLLWWSPSWTWLSSRRFGLERNKINRRRAAMKVEEVVEISSVLVCAADRVLTSRKLATGSRSTKRPHRSAKKSLSTSVSDDESGDNGIVISAANASVFQSDKTYDSTIFKSMFVFYIF